MWAPVVAEIPVLWWQAENIHWILGKAQMEKRGSDDSFPTIRVDLPPPEVSQQQQSSPSGSGWLKSSMWANIAEEMAVSWQAAEEMHWRLGAKNIAERSDAALTLENLTFQAILASSMFPEPALE
ncbi:hypothetical protein E4U61_007080 [Claviceps capensis]|nr:hypothetical protein E4U61_007080 [Claviceps capensis]